MCGRYALALTGEDVARAMDATISAPQVARVAAWAARFNIAPTQLAPVVLPRHEGDREVVLMRWGLIPLWAKDESIGGRLANARGETLAEKPAFREAWKRRRCLIPATAFYEWRAAIGEPSADAGEPTGVPPRNGRRRPEVAESLESARSKPSKSKSRAKQPYAIAAEQGEDGLFALGGIWEGWTPRGEDGSPGEIRSFAIITVDANDLMRPIHDRMPLVVPRGSWSAWLEAASPPQQLVIPHPPQGMRAWPISTRVNSPRYDAPDCLDALATP